VITHLFLGIYRLFLFYNYRFSNFHLLSPEGCYAVIGPVFIQRDDFSFFQFGNADDMKRA